jgi:hypothetical protein
MEEIVKELVKQGALAILAGALLYLHVTALEAFRGELAAERTGFLARNQAVVDALTKQTEVLSQRFDALSQTLQEIERRHYSQK